MSVLIQLKNQVLALTEDLAKNRPIEASRDCVQEEATPFGTDPLSRQEKEEKLALLKGLIRGEESIADGKLLSHEEAMLRLEQCFD